MPRVRLEQGTQEWLNWRKDKITASDVAKIMGISPYGTPYSLWAEKTGRKDAQANNSNMEYGQRMEPLIRSTWESVTEVGFMPACYVSNDREYLAASLDGIDIDETTILEIKLCNKEVFEKAKSNEIVPWYYVQMQTQLLCVPSAQSVDAVFCNGVKGDIVAPENIVSVSVLPDAEMQAKILRKCDEFYEKFWKEDVSPPYSDQDYVYIGDNAKFTAAEQEWLAAENNLKWAKKIEEEARKRMLMEAGDRNVEGDYVKIAKIFRTGTIDYKELCKDLGVGEETLSNYRKPGSSYFRPYIK